VAKVKKRAGLTGVRNVKASKAKRPAAGKRSTGRSKKVVSKNKIATKKKAVAKKKRSMKKPALKLLPAKKGKKGRPAPPAPVVRATVRELDPQQKCGEGTSVQFLYRVDETVDERTTTHLVFFDRHGWYCEHGRTCPAVAHAKKHNGQIARVS
jgi:hypothetical protein